MTGMAANDNRASLLMESAMSSSMPNVRAAFFMTCRTMGVFAMSATSRPRVDRFPQLITARSRLINHGPLSRRRFAPACEKFWSKKWD
jgi:hypothetical protein